jgi:hypothetical protein
MIPRHPAQISRETGAEIPSGPAGGLALAGT